MKDRSARARRRETGSSRRRGELDRGRCTVSEPRNIARLVRVSPQGDSESPSESEVGELEVTLLVDEEVLGLKIAVKNAVGVEVVNSLDELIGLLKGWKAR